MGFTLPDKGEGDSNIQSILFQEYIDVLVAGIGGQDCVLSGLAMTGAASMTPTVAKGAVLSNGTMFAVVGGGVVISAADATNPRIDLVVVNSSGTLTKRTGTAAAAPMPPARSANDVVIAAIYVPANDTTIGQSQITDLRVIRQQGPIVIYKTTVAETTNNTSSAIEALNKTSGGLTIPNGLFTAGRILRVRLGGNMLLNSGTPTVTFAVIFDGTTMYSDVSGASTNDTDRLAWWVDFDIVAQANADQAVVGHTSFGALGAKTAPTTGTGDTWSTLANSAQFNGGSAVDCDAANRLLEVQITFSVANAANELVVETASVELL